MTRARAYFRSRAPHDCKTPRLSVTLKAFHGGMNEGLKELGGPCLSCASFAGARDQWLCRGRDYAQMIYDLAVRA